MKLLRTVQYSTCKMLIKRFYSIPPSVISLFYSHNQHIWLGILFQGEIRSWSLTSTGGKNWHHEDSLTWLSWRWRRDERNFQSAMSHCAFNKLHSISTSKLQGKRTKVSLVCSCPVGFHSQSKGKAARDQLVSEVSRAGASPLLALQHTV